MSKYTVTIIGCGSIGSSKSDVYDSPTTDAVLTHAHAFTKHPDTEIKALIDSDLDKAFAAGQKWRTPKGVLVADKINKIADADIVVVAVPTEYHETVMIDVLKLKPRLVVCEKPFCESLAQARYVHDQYAEAKIPIAVDYIRRFDAIAAPVFADLRAGKYGDVQHARCLYGRGLRRDGCHGLDIFLHTLGDVRGVSFEHRGIDDSPEGWRDRSFTLRIEFERCREAYLVGTDSRKWGAFEVDFATDEGVLRFSNWGKTFQHFRAAPEKTFGQYNALAASAEKIETGLTKALLYLADNCVRHLRDGESLLCTSVDAIRVHEILEAVK